MKQILVMMAAVVVVGCGEKPTADLNAGGDQPLSEFEKTKAEAEAGDVEAQYSLGVMYDGGDGVPQDFKEAVKWYRKAAEQGEAFAQNNLGMMYGRGDGCALDDMTAYAWFIIGTANGDKSAKHNKDFLAEKMTPDQIAKAQELSREMIKKNPKLINEVTALIPPRESP